MKIVIDLELESPFEKKELISHVKNTFKMKLKTRFNLKKVSVEVIN